MNYGKTIEIEAKMKFGILGAKADSVTHVVEEIRNAGTDFSVGIRILGRNPIPPYVTVLGARFERNSDTWEIPATETTEGYFLYVYTAEVSYG